MTLNWEDYGGFDFRNMAVLGSKLYFVEYCYGLCHAPLTDLISWSELSLPPDVYNNSTLTTYQSQLVLVRGMISNYEWTNKVWTSADGHNWHQSLPPMSRCYQFPMAISFTNPECLIVGGDDNTGTTTIEVFFRGEWTSVHLPGPFQFDGVQLQATIHCGCLYLGAYRYRWEPLRCIYCCEVESLLASCTKTAGGDGEKELWKTIINPPNYEKINTLLVSFEQHLLAFSGGATYVFSPNTRSWVLMGDNPLKSPVCAATFSGHILFGSPTCYKATLEGMCINVYAHCIKYNITIQCLHIILTVSSAGVLSLDWRQQESLH